MVMAGMESVVSTLSLVRPWSVVVAAGAEFTAAVAMVSVTKMEVVARKGTKRLGFIKQRNREKVECRVPAIS